MKKVLRFSLVLLMMFCIVSLGFQNISNATKYSSEMQELITANYTDSTNSTGKINNLVGTIISAIRIVGVAVAVVVLLALAMKYMTAAPGDKADVKKSLVTYTIGACVFFGVVGILEIISNFANAIK